MRERCNKCSKFFDSMEIFSYGEERYCINCLHENYKKMKKPLAFIETNSHFEINGHSVEVKSLTLVTLSRKNSSIITQTNNEYSNIKNSDETLSLDMGIQSQIQSHIDSDNVYEKLLEEKEKLQDG